MSRMSLTERIKLSTEPLLLPLVKVLVNLNVHPNVITLLCFLGFIISAFFIAQGRFLVAGLVLLIFAPLDAVDGLLARTAKKVTAFGAFLDSTMDRYGEIFLFLALTYYFMLKGSVSGILLSFLGITGSLMVSYTRARAEGVGIACKVGLLTRFERLTLIIISLILDSIFLCLTILAFFTHLTTFQRIWHVYKNSKEIK
ncbi:CDP-alcohol phosphatidyltransferase [Caldimicrobium thiodismutans]|uniref:CDP-alcohol phosphatidyltransferase n=1 Tax=Caldimicrobium thiodismutans TaxID=1653476 RepID=A0A0U4W3P8_9BACT|nr:CDP-alcohol phosphatidyltransferase family protein [Caldimicrobium thiodismutans]BAU23722.1 CDP-alcohol phosphatidyltransferase [Caldimicrobium thiodismutans]